jgi:beta-N-acetylhexosaminidase
MMIAHLLMPEFDTEHPASVSPAIISGLLRGELGFDGLAVSDGMGMAAVRERYGLAGGAVRALIAGIDVVCVDKDTKEEEMVEIASAIRAALRDGSLPEARLVEAAERVAGFAAWRREARDGWPDSTGMAGGAADEVGDGLAAARRAVTVLRADDGALPLTTPPHVVEAVLPRSFAAAVAELLPGTTSSELADVTDAAGDGSVGDIPGDRPLVIAVRGIQRSPEDLDRVIRLVKEHPDAVVVDLGVANLDVGGAAWIAGYGASRVCLRAAAEVLTGRQ